MPQELKSHSGVMVALMVPQEAGAMLWQATLAAAMPAGAELLPSSEYHLTLGYFGDSTELDDTVRGQMAQALSAWAALTPPLTGVISGMGRFNAEEGEPHPVYASFDAPDLVGFRTALIAALTAAGASPTSSHGFDPHITLAYIPADAETPDVRLAPVSVTFGAVTLAWGDIHSSFPLSGTKAAPSVEPRAASPTVLRSRVQARGDGLMEKREIKPSPQHIKSISGRTVTGIFSVFGNVDSYGDIIMPGAFSKTLRERGNKIVHLWQHDFWSPPIAVINDIREIGKDALPEGIRRDYPEATGAMEVTRTYVDTPRANEVLTLLQAGVPLEMSFAFDPIQIAYDDKTGTRLLKEVKLYEVSDVLWGANSATMASRAGGFPLDMLALHIERYAAEAKAGARHSTADTALINAIHKAAVDLGCTECAGMLGDDDDMAKQLQFTVTADSLGVQLRADSIERMVKTALLTELGLTLAPVSTPEATSDDDASRAASDEALTRQRRMRLNEAALRLRGVAVPQESE